MTDHNPYSVESTGSTVTSSQGDKMQTAKQDASEVAGTAKQGASEVAHETVQQAKVVSGVAMDHARSLMGETTTQLRGHADDQAQRAASGLDQVATKVQALLSGRPEEAGELRDYAEELGDRAQQLAERLRSGGFDGIVADASRFARRRPGLFLAGAATAGFVVGRLVKAQRSEGSDNGQEQGRYRLSTTVPQAEYPYPGAGYPATSAVPPLPDATTPPAVDAIPSVGAGTTYGTSRASTERETW